MQKVPLLLLLALLAAFAAGFWLLLGGTEAPLPTPGKTGAVAEEGANAAVGGAPSPATGAQKVGAQAATDAAPERTAVPTSDAASVAAELVGKLVDTKGSPVAGAEIVLDSYPDFGIAAPVPTERGNGGRATTRSGPDGAFRLPMPIGRRGSLELTDEGLVFATGSPHIGPNAADRALGEVVVAKAGVIEGVVTDERGAPIADVKVGARIEPMFGTSSSTATDAQGRFRLGKLHAGEWIVRTATPHFLPTATPVTLAKDEQKSGLTIRLERGAVISGRVVDDLGAPVAGGKVAAQRREERGGMRIERFATDEAAVTDASGYFTLAGLSGETATIRAIVAGHTEAIASNVPVGSGDVLLKVQRLGTLVGLLVGEDGTPIPGSAVSVRPGDGSMEEQIGFGDGEGLPLLAGRANAKTGSDGAFRLEGVAPGKLSVLAQGSGHRPAKLSGITLAAGQELTGLRLVAQAGASAVLTVVDPDGQPIAGAEVVARRGGEEPSLGGGMVRARSVAINDEDGGVQIFGGDEELGRDKTDAQGKVVLSALPEGRLAFSAKHETHADAVPVQMDVPRAGRIEGRLQLRTAGFAEVAVFGADGAPESGARFLVEGPLGAPDSSSRPLATGGDGKQKVGPLAAGEYRAVLLRTPEMQNFGGAMVMLGGDDREFASSERRFLVGGGRTTVLDLRKPPLVALTGRVLGAEGPVANCVVSLAEEDGDQPQFGGLEGRSTTTDGDGRYRFDDVVPGRMVFRYGPRDCIVKAKHTVDVPGDRTELEQDLLLRTGSLRVQAVVDGTGQPLGGAMVELREFVPGAGGARQERRMMMVTIGTTGDENGAEASTITLGENRVRTGADGFATVDNVPVGTYSVVVSHPAHVKASVDEQVVVERQVTDAGRVALRPAGSIKGVVRGADGSAVAFAMVECVSVDGANPDQQPAMRGNFRFEELAPGRYRLRARAAGLDGTPPGGWGEAIEVEVKGGEATGAELRMPAR